MPIDMNAGTTGPQPSDKPGAARTQRRERSGVEIGLNAAILAVRGNEPLVLVVRQEGEARTGFDSLPFGPFSPTEHRTLDAGLRAWVAEQTGLELGYVEQLYTFGDRGRNAVPGDTAPHVVSIGYLALTRLGDETSGDSRGLWRSWYDHFPWEDWRNGRPDILGEEIIPRLKDWTENPHAAGSHRPIRRSERVRMCFGLDGAAWDEEKVLDRYELLYEAGLVEEARRDGREAAEAWVEPLPKLGTPMRFDHRRILATAIGRIRSKIKWRPVVFELMNDEFTLFELQRTVEAILGPHLHKQNFRRLVETAGLVEPTGEVRAKTGGRPAKLFRFRRDVLLERPAPGVRVKLGVRG
ncbi:MAG: NAD regulator [Hyphomicrobiaceae bacterium]